MSINSENADLLMSKLSMAVTNPEKNEVAVRKFSGTRCEWFMKRSPRSKAGCDSELSDKLLTVRKPAMHAP